MTVTWHDLAELSQAGVPVNDALGHLYARPDFSLLHAEQACRPGLAAFHLTGPQRPSGREGELAPCEKCCHYPLSKTVGDILNALESTLDKVRHVQRSYQRALEELLDTAPSDHVLRKAAHALRVLRLQVDRTLYANGIPGLLRGTDQWPKVLQDWAATYLTTTVGRTDVLMARYLAHGKLERTVENRKVQLWDGYLDAPDHYVAVGDPVGELLGTSLLVDAFLAYTPLLWMGGWALYRMPAGLATLLGPNAIDGNLRDGGPVHPDDTPQMLRAAAAMFDGTNFSAPMADPFTVLNIARELTMA